jgi:hypothetical protein
MEMVLREVIFTLGKRLQGAMGLRHPRKVDGEGGEDDLSL